MLLHIVLLWTTPSLLERDESARIRICLRVYVFCMRWASHESYAGLHTHKRCCCTLCYCSTTPSLLVRDESAIQLIHPREALLALCVLLVLTNHTCVPNCITHLSHNSPHENCDRPDRFSKLAHIFRTSFTSSSLKTSSIALQALGREHVSLPSDTPCSC